MKMWSVILTRDCGTTAAIVLNARNATTARRRALGYMKARWHVLRIHDLTDTEAAKPIDGKSAAAGEKIKG